jgi:hypothetical protein
VVVERPSLAWGSCHHCVHYKRLGQIVDAQVALLLPIRTLKTQLAQDASAGLSTCDHDKTVLHSLIPWSEKLDVRRPASLIEPLTVTQEVVSI